MHYIVRLSFQRKATGTIRSETMIDFGTIATAMVTPFDISGNIDFAKTTKLVNYLIDNGTTAIVVGGTTGESPTLTSEESSVISPCRICCR